MKKGNANPKKRRQPRNRLFAMIDKAQEKDVRVSRRILQKEIDEAVVSARRKSY